MTAETRQRYREAGERAAQEQRRIQERIDGRERHQQDGGKEQQRNVSGNGVQTYPREQPGTPLPAQHLEKPGLESELDPSPRYRAEEYAGSAKLKDRAAIVTGGDSGIGRAVSVLFAREGADVAVVYLSEHEDAEETKHAVESEGRRCILIAGDVRDPEFCEAAVRETLDEFGRLDVLVNNAGFQEHVSGLEQLTDEHLDMTMRTNVYGYVHMARAALPHLRAGGSIINNGSETGLFGNAQLLDYAATKGAIHAFTMALARSVAERGIRVNAVAPGPVWTPLNPADAPADVIRDFGGSTPLKRPAQPEEVAPAFVFLASPVCSSYVTGAILPVMGGPTGSE
jgi:NAD(P)-dependent dehydrogenase (short-subunit alcohol dehydrogenase family)